MLFLSWFYVISDPVLGVFFGVFVWGFKVKGVSKVGRRPLDLGPKSGSPLILGV